MATDYTNALGTGNRKDSIDVYVTPGFVTIAANYFNVLVDGDLGAFQTFYIPTGTNIAGKSITWDFRTGKIIDQIRVTLEQAQDQGKWKISGSNDNSTWATIAESVAFTTGDTVVYLTFANSTSYRLYRITGVGDYGTQTNWRETDFKIDAGDSTYAASTDYANAGGTGDRTGSITMSAESGLFANENYSGLLDGVTTGTINYVPSGTGFQGKSATFDFGVGARKCVDAIRITTAIVLEQGAWDISGSDNNSDYTPIASAVLGTNLDTMPREFRFFNANGYRYYRMTGASGTVSQTWWSEIEFRIADWVAPVNITTASLDSGIVGVAYSDTVAATGGTAPITFEVSAGALPDGLSLASNGAITGTPTVAGEFNFTVTATDSASPVKTDAQALSITIGAALAITTTTLVGGTVGTAYSATVASTGGTAPVTFAVTSGSLPAGLSMSTGGAITGTPTTAGTSSFTVTATDDTSPVQTDAQALSIVIAAASAGGEARRTPGSPGSPLVFGATLSRETAGSAGSPVGPDLTTPTRAVPGSPGSPVTRTS